MWPVVNRGPHVVVIIKAAPYVHVVVVVIKAAQYMLFCGYKGCAIHTDSIIEKNNAYIQCGRLITAFAA